MIRLTLRPYLVDPAHHEANLCPTDAGAIRYELGSPAPVWASLGDYDLRPLLAKLTVPVLVIEGARTVVPLDSTRAYAAKGRLLLLEGVGHAVIFEGGDAFFRAADAFLRGR